VAGDNEQMPAEVDDGAETGAETGGAAADDVGRSGLLGPADLRIDDTCSVERSGVFKDGRRIFLPLPSDAIGSAIDEDGLDL
jgi:hypothetical protein